MNKKKRLGNDPLDFIQDSRQEQKKQTETQAETFTQSQANTFSKTFAKTFADSIKDKASSGGQSGKLEDNRKRQTFWLDKEEISMINQLSKKAGVSKYQVMAAAIRLLYDYVFNEQEK